VHAGRSGRHRRISIRGLVLAPVRV